MGLWCSITALRGGTHPRHPDPAVSRLPGIEYLARASQPHQLRLHLPAWRQTFWTSGLVPAPHWRRSWTSQPPGWGRRMDDGSPGWRPRSDRTGAPFPPMAAPPTVPASGRSTRNCGGEGSGPVNVWPPCSGNLYLAQRGDRVPSPLGLWGASRPYGVGHFPATLLQLRSGHQTAGDPDGSHRTAALLRMVRYTSIPLLMFLTGVHTSVILPRTLSPSHFAPCLLRLCTLLWGAAAISVPGPLSRGARNARLHSPIRSGHFQLRQETAGPEGESARGQARVHSPRRGGGRSGGPGRVRPRRPGTCGRRPGCCGAGRIPGLGLRLFRRIQDRDFFCGSEERGLSGGWLALLQRMQPLGAPAGLPG